MCTYRAIDVAEDYDLEPDPKYKVSDTALICIILILICVGADTLRP